MKLTPPKNKREQINWSTQQKAVFEAVEKMSGSLQVEAVAGSGKTTTIVEAMNYIPKGKTAIFVAFNKAIATELSTKVPAGIEAKTLHAIGWKQMMDNKYKVWKTKTRIIIEDLVNADPTLEDEYIYEILRPASTVIG